MVSMSFRLLIKFSIEEEPFGQLLITSEWQAWETVWIFRLPFISKNFSIYPILFESGCDINNTTNCKKECNSKQTLFGSPESLWNCLTIAAVVADRGFINWGRWRDTATVLFNPTPIRGCLSELWEDKFQYIPLNLSIIEDLGRIMGEDYCTGADPSIDFDIVGPGVCVTLTIVKCDQQLMILRILVVYLITLVFPGVQDCQDLDSELLSCIPAAVKRAIQGCENRSSMAELCRIMQIRHCSRSCISAIIAFSGSSSAGLANISLSLLWLANNLILRGVVSAGMYPLLFIQLILHKTHNRWWYTLFQVILNWVLMLVITHPGVMGIEALEKHVKKNNAIDHCGGNTGMGTYYFSDGLVSSRTLAGLGSNFTDGRLDLKNGNHYLLRQNMDSYFKIHSNIQSPINTIMVFLILDWIYAMLKAQSSESGTWLYSRTRFLTQRSLSQAHRFHETKYFWLLTEALWVSMEALSVMMDFLGVLRDGKEDGESDIYISNWSFEQLIAACVWYPTILKFLCLNIGGVLPSLQKRVGDMIEATYRTGDERSDSDVALETLIPPGRIERSRNDGMESHRLTPRRSWGRTVKRSIEMYQGLGDPRNRSGQSNWQPGTSAAPKECVWFSSQMKLRNFDVLE
ncbi:unnamed protein product [Fusarium venenatum]|uniref:Uncharacterized protein n=1 Tax=Fusarium venenatum TaxID=56646 RepID=A0A2L2TG50_9HYPO|nr:uncharacterized protein FVRRES_06432 [Fusarium venenatum]CEI61996.1 unnamed protein product [Fusarium venenatum]